MYLSFKMLPHRGNSQRDCVLLQTNNRFLLERLHQTGNPCWGEIYFKLLQGRIVRGALKGLSLWAVALFVALQIHLFSKFILFWVRDGATREALRT